ncbi:MAG: hypothetical protein QM784_30040 [Polyangiaceae bacterium]
MDTDLVRSQLPEGEPGGNVQLERHRRAAAGAGLQSRSFEGPRQNLAIPRRAEAQGSSVDGRRIELRSCGDDASITEPLSRGDDLENAQGWDGPQQVRKQQRRGGVDDLGKLVVQLLPDSTGEECDALEQSLHVRIRSRLSEDGRQRWILACKLPTQIAKISELVLIVLVEQLGPCSAGADEVTDFVWREPSRAEVGR